MEKVFKIVTNLTEEENANIASEEETANIELISSVDRIDTSGITTYIICDTENLSKVEELLLKNSIKFKTEDITTQFMRGEVEIDDDEFKSHLEKSLTVDMVLDKIREKGIESLSELDKTILKK